MSRYQVVTPDAQYEDDAEIERAAAGTYFDFRIFRERSADCIPLDAWRNADALLVWHEVPIDRDLIAELAHCRVIVRAGVGFDHIDLAAAGAAGIPVCNTPDYGTSEVADHAMGMLLALRRGLAYYNRQLYADPVGRFKPGAPAVARVRGSQLGLVGLGRIGTAMALRAKAFGMQVCFYDPYAPRGQEIALGISRAETLPQLLAHSDAVSLHAPLTSETQNLFNANTLALMPPHAVLINTARGAIVDIDAVYNALVEERLAGAALDVYPEEPPDSSRPLIAALARDDAWLQDRLILSPHAAWHSPASRRDARRLSTETLVAYMRDGELRNCVNKKFIA